MELSRSHRVYSSLVLIDLPAVVVIIMSFPKGHGYRQYRSFPSGSSGKEPDCQCRRYEMQVRALEIPWRRAGNLLHYSCLENPMDRGAWQATVHGVAKSQTQLKRLSMHAYVCIFGLTAQHMGSSSLTKEQTHAPFTGSSESSPLGCQVSPLLGILVPQPHLLKLSDNLGEN